jgi:acyl-CoA reductase-like NAD-dependent aldehyde dehydrogenase
LGEHRGLVRNLILDHRNTEQLITSGLIDHVSFTGSKNGGHDIYTATARNFIEVGLELGGKDPAYVAPDADLDFSVANLVDGAMYNAGQSCCGIERVYVHAGLYDRFIEKAEKLIADYKLGDPMSEETTMGPLAMKSTLALCEKQVVEANSKGARLFGGGKQLRIGKGNFFEPTLIADIPNNHLSIMQEENFGPVLPVMKVESDEQAINLMNDSIYGLTAVVCTQSLGRAKHFGQMLEAGTVFMNRCDYLDPALPWTGTKSSGKGVSLSKYGFHALTKRKGLHFRINTS